MDLLLSVLASFVEYSKEYPAISGVFGLWLLATGTMILKSVPKKAWEVVLRNITTTLTLVNTSQSFYLFLKWYESNDYSCNSRSIKMSNGQYGSSGTATKAMGYGNHYFIFNKMPIKLNLVQLDAVGSYKERDQIKMTVLGRSHGTFDLIFESIKLKNLDRDKIIIHKFKENWTRASEQRKRDFNTLYLNMGVKEEIIEFVTNFEAREEFNLKHGINHQTAIMLYGPPGTGKTSVIKAIASHFDKKIYNLNASAMQYIESAFFSLPEDSLVVIEDIDSEMALHGRVIQKDGDASDSNAAAYCFTSMSDVLNAIDGLHCSHGRILIATTNHIEKLDPALIRSGRFDLKIKIDYASNYTLEQFINTFFSGNMLPDNFHIDDEISSSDIQSSALKNLGNFYGFLRPLGDVCSG